MKNKVDAIWDTIWTGGITSPITVLEQITYLMFMKLLDDNQLKAEANANLLGVPLKNKVFQDGMCVISENPRVETEYKNLRWNVFHNFEPGEMLTNIQTYVFPFIKTIGEGKDTAFSRYMKDTVFLIPTAKVLAKVVDHHLAVAAKLGGDALGHLFKQIQLSRFQLYHPSSGFPFSLYLYLYHIILSIEINDYF